MIKQLEAGFETQMEVSATDVLRAEKTDQLELELLVQQLVKNIDFSGYVDIPKMARHMGR